MAPRKYIATDEDRAMVANPLEWPRWPFLPMKRAAEGWPEAGFLMATEEHRYTVFHGSVFRIPTCDLRDVPKMFPRQDKYPNAEALFEAGWVVD